MRFPNPISKRLDFVKQQYENRPEVYDLTLDTVKRAYRRAYKDGDIDFATDAPWQDRIPVLARDINKAVKSRNKGPISESGYRESLLAAKSDFLRHAAQKEREVARGKLTSLRRKQRKRILSEPPTGFKIVEKHLPHGHVGVIATPNLRAPKLRKKRSIETKINWVEQNAPFQQWLGVSMGNCLQFYYVNYAPYGIDHYRTQKLGGKLYAVIDRRGKPVSAILTRKDGSIGEVNGIGNVAPSGEALDATISLIEKISKPKIKTIKTSDRSSRKDRDRSIAELREDYRYKSIIREKRLKSLPETIEYIYKNWPISKVGERNLWLDRIHVALHQNDLNLNCAIKRFMVYVLKDSNLSVVSSLEKSRGSNWRKEKKDTLRAISVLDSLEIRYDSCSPTRMKDFYHKIHTKKFNIYTPARHSVEFIIGENAFDLRVFIELSARMAAASGIVENFSLAIYHYAAALLYFVEQQAQGRRRRRNPSSEKVPSLHALLGVRKGSKKTTKKTTARRANPSRKTKSPTAAALKKECRRLWEHYCERPNKTRLRAVLKHCELMAESTAKSVKEERGRCMRSARREMKKLGMK